MASLNPLTREVVFKIVFYGPGLGGKTTTLQHIHAASKPEHRGKMVSLATPMDRTLYFDFLPLRMPLVHGMHVRLQLFTVPGQVYFGATRKLVLTGADGVVFVADSQTGRQDANQEALEDLVMNLAENNLALLGMPHTFHWNKRDLPDILSLADLDRTLNRQGAPSIGTIATKGDGVFAGLERIARLVFHAYEADLPKSEVTPVDRAPAERAPIEETTIADALRGLAEAPERARTTPVELAAGAKVSPGSVRGAPPSSSSLESIPNPIPRRPTGSFDAAPTSAPAPSAPTPLPGRVASSPQRVAGAAATPAPPGDPFASPARTPSPPSPRVTPAGLAAAVGPAGPHHDHGRGGMDAVEGAASSPHPSARDGRGSAAFSFAPMWAEGDREAARQVELALAAGDSAGATLLCDVLVTRLLAAAAGLTGNADAPRDPGLVVLLLGLDGKRYLAFRASVRAGRMSEALRLSEALEAYAFALDVRRALAAIAP